MSEAVRNIIPTPHLEYASVLVASEDGFELSCGGDRLHAVPSASCMMRPAPGDEVLVSLDRTGRCFILSVLVRAEDAPVTDLDFTGQVNLNVSGGSLNILAEKDVNIAAAEQCALMAERVTALADSGEVRIERMSVLGQVLQSNIQIVHAVAERIETTAKRLTQRFKDMFCYVEEQSEHQAGNERHVVEETLTMHAKNAFHVADEIVKVDAEQVHLG